MIRKDSFMTLKKRMILWLFSLSCYFIASTAYAQRFITIGTGPINGVYYPAGGAICKLVNQGRQQHNLRCLVESTTGSIYNINKLKDKEFEFSVVQSDWQFHGYNGTSQFKDQGPYSKMRAIFSLHDEPFNIIVRKDLGINDLDDLKGKRINIGESGSGDRATMEIVMNSLGWTHSDFKLISIPAAERSEALCNNEIDAYIYLVGHPNGAIKEAAVYCDAKLIPTTGANIEKIIADHPFYTKSITPHGFYKGIKEDTESFGVSATLISSTDVSEEIVYALTKSIFSNFDTFKRLHPAFANLTKAGMLQNGLSVPFHPGAIRYYQEAGFLPPNEQY